MAYKHKADQVIASRRHYLANKHYYLERNRRYRKELTTFVNSIKESTPCADCKLCYPYYVMDFDHLDGHIKEGLVSHFMKNRRRLGMIDEIKKCDVVCANCHRIRTHTRRLQKSQKDV